MLATGMKFRNKRRWRIIRDYSVGWTLAFIFLSIVRGSGTLELGSVQFDLWSSILVACFLGPFFGSISGYAQVLMESKVYGRMSLQKLLILRVIYFLLFIALLTLVSYTLVTRVFEVNVGLAEFMVEPGSFAIYFYILTVDVFMIILAQVNLLLGGNNLKKLLLGKFYKPHEEERIFMFLDLQSSTQLAEKLGHIRYSLFIQDCFNDLAIVLENEAEIYQYVGDEVILTWELKDGLRNQNCLHAYFNFKQKLVDRRNHYIEKYGVVPFFKAGMNAGNVTVTEVGKYKKEIAYHGDTLNTAARIQGKCNDFNQELLISGYLLDQLEQDGFSFEELAGISLRGKSEEVSIYAVVQGTGGLQAVDAA